MIMFPEIAKNCLKKIATESLTTWNGCLERYNFFAIIMSINDTNGDIGWDMLNGLQ